ncbi:hypothetical protein NDU88_006052 [Pleurodeles waltl]|uniref:Secreted protein n=1 Tax=Pleurodeles waltl TaxID=8319 RepID=A0AAV7UJY0_PLEWA|nr:hypothetical protein NDU88_006052 [Pleurodeles waltl]
MVVTSAAVTSAAVRIITASAPVHWLLGPIGSNVNQCSIAPRSTTAYRDGVQRQRSYPTIPMSQHRHLGHIARWRNPLVYRPLVDLLTMEERHVIVTYRFDRATIQELWGIFILRLRRNCVVFFYAKLTPYLYFGVRRV